MPILQLQMFLDLDCVFQPVEWVWMVQRSQALGMKEVAENTNELTT